MNIEISVPSALVPPAVADPAAAAQAAPRTHHVWRAAGRGLERAGLAAPALAGALTFSQFHMFGLFPDSLLGALLLGLLASAIIGLTGLAWKLLGLAARGLGRLAEPRLGAAALRPAQVMRGMRGEVFGAVIAPLFLVLVDRTQVPGLNTIRLMAPGELLTPTLLIGGALVGVALWGRLRSRVRWTLVAAALLLNALPLGWLLYRGNADYLSRPDTAALAALPQLAGVSPGERGPYAVQTLTYGSGQDKHRRAYGAGADLITASVDGKAAWSGYSGLIGGFYEWWYGFDTSRLPLNGLVWYPAGEGPFPLALIVHGNHNAGDYSEGGYAYLCEHLASRGFIAVSVDENFLNGWFIYDGEGKEMAVRSWLLLKHLQAWRQWNADAANVFYGKVDLARVALMGHSRGGEAAAHAAAMNTKFYAPITKVAQAGEFGFGIKAVVGIAPPDGQYKPGGANQYLTDVSYLALYGGHDQDLFWAAPLQQYNRVSFEQDAAAFKAVAYVYRANHGQFNTVWGDADYGMMNSLLLNRAPLLTAEEQRTAGKVFITAFLEAALLGKAEGRAVFQQAASARAWLPQDVIITQYEDATFQGVSTHQRLASADAGDAPAVRTASTGFAVARRVALHLRNGIEQGNNALFLHWDAGSRPVHTILLPAGDDFAWHITERSALAFALGTALDDATPIAVTVELTDGDGTRVALPLSRFGVVHPPVMAHLEKSQAVSRALNADWYAKLSTPYERVLQSYQLPLAAFAGQDLAFDAGAIRAIRFLFDGAAGGKAYLDQVGFTG